MLIGVFLLSACATVQRMTADQVQATFVGMTGYGTSANGEPFVTYLAPDGTIRLRRNGQSDAGRYRIEPDGVLCVQYQAYRQGQDVCQSVWKGTDRYYTTQSNGQPGVTITTVKPGNAENL
ncbi:MAG TPA: hypothetical protein VL614_08735 [Acetobacteraceae bacterium]|nr:hypothetical protein [Acetobacteraceae bacterium]